MKKLCFLLLIAWAIIVLPGSLQAGSAEIIGTQGKCTDGNSPDDVISEARIGTRSSTFPDAKKSWLQFDLSDLYGYNPGLMGNITNAKLVLYGANTEPSDKDYVVSGLNDAAGLEGWNATTLTWNNAPGNDTSTGAGLNASVTTQLYTGTVLLPCLDILTETPVADQPTLTAFLNTDTDGKVTLIFTAGDTAYLWNVDSDLEPVLVIEGVLKVPCEGVGIQHSFYANESSRSDIQSPTANTSDASKLTVRVAPTDIPPKSNKSWIKFDISGQVPNNLKTATLTIALSDPEGGSHTVNLSAVNDGYTTNIGWTSTNLTWNNAPGNDTTSLVDLTAAQTTPVTTVNVVDGLAGTQYEIDVLSILQADTDGIIQFVLHNSDVLMNFATHNHPSGETYYPRLDILEAPAGADKPSPCPGDIVSTDLAGLSWKNPDPGGASPITCTVYLGTEPNRIGNMDSVTLTSGAESVVINVTNFPNFYPLENLETYYWTVDCDDPSVGLIPGLMWDFYVNNNEAPVVDAGPAQAVWLGKSGTPGQELVYLDGTTSDDGLPNPPAAYTVLWTQEDNGAPAVTISPDSVEDTSVTIMERGDYVFVLTADDGADNDFDTVRIVVGTDACDASHIQTGSVYDPGDVNEDCIVDLQDFALLIAANWLNCTDTEMNCGN
jgi:hypothetical protein